MKISNIVEILDIKKREINSERVMLGSAAVFYAAYFKEIIDGSFWLLLVPIVIGIFGFLRLREYQRNILEIDSYLRENEFLFSSTGYQP